MVDQGRTVEKIVLSGIKEIGMLCFPKMIADLTEPQLGQLPPRGPHAAPVSVASVRAAPASTRTPDPLELRRKAIRRELTKRIMASITAGNTVQSSSKELRLYQALESETPITNARMRSRLDDTKDYSTPQAIDFLVLIVGDNGEAGGGGSGDEAAFGGNGRAGGGDDAVAVVGGNGNDDGGDDEVVFVRVVGGNGNDDGGDDEVTVLGNGGAGGGDDEVVVVGNGRGAGGGSAEDWSVGTATGHSSSFRRHQFTAVAQWACRYNSPTQRTSDACECRPSRGTSGSRPRRQW